MNAIPERPLQEPYLPDAPEISQEQIDERMVEELQRYRYEPSEILCAYFTAKAQEFQYEIAKSLFRNNLAEFLLRNTPANAEVLGRSVAYLARASWGEVLREEMEIEGAE